jgi:hypothetical protein
MDTRATLRDAPLFARLSQASPVNEKLLLAAALVIIWREVGMGKRLRRRFIASSRDQNR